MAIVATDYRTKWTGNETIPIAVTKLLFKDNKGCPCLSVIVVMTNGNFAYSHQSTIYLQSTGILTMPIVYPQLLLGPSVLNLILCVQYNSRFLLLGNKTLHRLPRLTAASAE